MTAALDGMRILDLTQWESGTSCTQALAWLGADVVKVEPPGGDPGRTLARGAQKESDYFVNWNSNKRSVVLDLRQAKGRQLLLDMAPKYDVFIENFGPGVIEKLNLTYPVLKAVHPQVIYASIKGFGLDGPYAQYKCFDAVAQASAGALSITGEMGGPPLRPGPTIGDSGSGIQMALAITAAYVQKLKTGEGQFIELSMQEAVTYFMRTMIALGAQGGTAAVPRLGNRMDATVDLFPCKPGGPNDYVYIMAVTDPMWKRLIARVGKPEYADDPRFETNMHRIMNGEPIREAITAWTSERTKQEAMKVLNEDDIPASMVFDTKDLFTDPHLLERGFVHEVEHAALGRIKLLGWAPRLSASHVDFKAASGLGEHTHEVLEQDLGLVESEIAALRSTGMLGPTP